MRRANDSVGGPVDRCDSYFVKLLGVEAYPVYVAFAVATGNELRIYFKTISRKCEKGGSFKSYATKETVQQPVYGFSGKHRPFYYAQ